MKSRKQHILAVLLVVVLLMQMFPLLTFAKPSLQTYSYDTFIKTKEDKGYSGEEPVKVSDKHYGWKLGKFVIAGYTTRKEEKGKPVFLKNIGDTVTLDFCLEQDIDKLNGDKKITIGRDKKGYDQYFQEKPQDFGRGALIVKYTDNRNSSKGPVVYRDYLSGLKVGANTHIDLYDEGDYEVALNYKVKNAIISIAGHKIVSTETDYRIFFKFSVRNGDSMVYLFDIDTRKELYDGSMTEKGFRLDVAKSDYLNIIIKKEVLKESADGLIEDTRFNKFAKDGDEFTDEGIYTITIATSYTSEPTIKKLYVGKSVLLKGFFTGIDSENSDNSEANENNESNNKNTTISKTTIIAIMAIIVILVFILILLKKRGTFENVHNNSQI